MDILGMRLGKAGNTWCPVSDINSALPALPTGLPCPLLAPGSEGTAASKGGLRELLSRGYPTVSPIPLPFTNPIPGWLHALPTSVASCGAAWPRSEASAE